MASGSVLLDCLLFACSVLFVSQTLTVLVLFALKLVVTLCLDFPAFSPISVAGLVVYVV